mmetsp:Transcript_121644/g.214481  ORF Transcript_121644/g.214481 Transcript_121644/m.214481 type:complete len:235 (-) Transcript_121644:181-885(-)
MEKDRDALHNPLIPVDAGSSEPDAEQAQQSHVEHHMTATQKASSGQGKAETDAAAESAAAAEALFGKDANFWITVLVLVVCFNSLGFFLWISCSVPTGLDSTCAERLVGNGARTLSWAVGAIVLGALLFYGVRCMVQCCWTCIKSDFSARVNTCFEKFCPGYTLPTRLLLYRTDKKLRAYVRKAYGCMAGCALVTMLLIMLSLHFSEKGKQARARDATPHFTPDFLQARRRPGA